MHTPDGLITGWICILMLIISSSIFLFSFYKVKKILNKKNLLLFSSLCALVFGFQMLNFPISSGTSGHFIGAGLIAIMLGPYAAVVGLAIVLFLQAIFFGDGGILALGVNVFNMGIVAAFVTYYLYMALKKFGNIISIGIASLAGVVSAAIFASLELGLSGTYAYLDTLTAMTSSHILVGFGEALITLSILFLLKKSYYIDEIKNKYYWKNVCFIGALTTILFLPFISSAPDAMESVAINLGFYEKAVTIYEGAPFNGYTLFGFESLFASVLVALIGMIMALTVSLLIINPKLLLKIRI